MIAPAYVRQLMSQQRGELIFRQTCYKDSRQQQDRSAAESPNRRRHPSRRDSQIDGRRNAHVAGNSPCHDQQFTGRDVRTADQPVELQDPVQDEPSPENAADDPSDGHDKTPRKTRHTVG